MQASPRWPIALGVALLLEACTAAVAPPRRPAEGAPRLTHGVVVGEVDATSAVLWARCSGPARLHLAVAGPRAPGVDPAALALPPRSVGPDGDFIATQRVRALLPATEYVVDAWCAGPDGQSSPGAAAEPGGDRATARFRTAPHPSDPAAVRFAWSGDLGGQNVCRDRDQGYAIFDLVGAWRPDLFVGLGDMIYADSPCLAVGRYGNAQIEGPPRRADLASYRAQWSYNRADPAFLRLLSATPYEAVWDDHEVLNDFGPRHDTAIRPPLAPGVHLLPIGRQAFLEWNPVRDERAGGRFYHSARRGRHLELFVLDTRSYRDANDAEDDDATPKSLLGDRQRRWLERAVARSDATWKVFVTSVPLSIATGSPDARDSFASGGGRLGFEHALLSLLRMLHRAGVETPVFITTDIHFQYVARHTPFAELPGFHPYELAVGPLNAGLASPVPPDPTLHPEVLHSDGPRPSQALDWDQARSWFNFGVIDVDRSGRLRLAVVDGTGRTRYELQLAPPRPPSP